MSDDCNHARVPRTRFGPAKCPDCAADVLVTPDGQVMDAVVLDLREVYPEAPEQVGEPTSAAETIGAIQEGAQRLLWMAMDRIRQLETALTEGRFQDAHTHLGEIGAKVAPLAQAQAGIALFNSERTIKRGRELEVGDYPVGLAPIASLHYGQEPQRSGERQQIVMRFEGDDDEDVQVDAEQEVVVWVNNG